MTGSTWFTLLNPETTVDDIAAVLDLIAGHAEQYLQTAAIPGPPFADPSVRRVVVEPDVTNSAVQALNKAVGFEVLREIAKPE
ncbi:hypothetical protein SBADM41S_01433 [Streptomyces badius]